MLPRMMTPTAVGQDMLPEGAIAVTIVMPCLNEAETLAVCIRKARRAIECSGLPGEVVVADNGSTDGSREIALAEGARLVPVPVRGYGAALYEGIHSAYGEYVLMGDADDSYDFADLPRFVEGLQGGADLVMGNRFRGGIKEGAMPFLHRYLGNPVLSFVGRLFFHAPVGDFHCGMRAFRKSAIVGLELRTTGMEFASEMVVRACLAKLKMQEVPTTLSPDGRSRAPHLRTWPDGWRHLRFLLLYSPRWLFFYPGILLTLVGAVGSIWLIPGERAIGRLHFDVDSLVYSLACVLIGFHAMIFATSAKIYATSTGLLPPDEKFNRWYRYLTLEAGLLTSILLLLVGIASFFIALHIWVRASLGPLNPTQILRVTLPSSAAIILGVEIGFSSFFFSLLGMQQRRG